MYHTLPLGHGGSEPVRDVAPGARRMHQDMTVRLEAVRGRFERSRITLLDVVNRQTPDAIRATEPGCEVAGRRYRADMEDIRWPGEPLPHRPGQIDDIPVRRGHTAVAARPRVPRAVVTNSKNRKIGKRRRETVKPHPVETREDERVRHRHERRRG